MSLRLTRPFALGGAASALLICFSAASAPAQTNPLADLAGSWSGNGTIAMSSGDRERIRCRATYAVGSDGRNLQQNIRCASDSYRFEFVSDVIYTDGKVYGNWGEVTRGIGGQINGRVSGGNIQALVEGAGFSASVTVNTRGDRQSVTIQPRGLDVTQVQMSLRRS